ALAKDRRYAEGELLAFLPRHQFQNPRITRCRKQDAGEHLYRRRLARAIRSDECQQLARLDTQRDASHRFDIPIARRDESAQAGAEARRLFAGAESLSKSTR